MWDKPVDAIQKARLEQSAAAVELWNIRLESLRAAGDDRGYLDHLLTPAECGGDNCTCNNACNSPCASTLMEAGGAFINVGKT